MVSKLVDSIFEVLAEVCPTYCLLRGFDEVVIKGDFNDIDVLVDRSTVALVVEKLRKMWGDVFTYSQISPFQGKLCGVVAEREVVIDLFFDVTWLGLSFYPVENINEDVVVRDGVRVLRFSPSAYIIVMKELLQNGRVKAWSGARETLPIWIAEDSERSELLFSRTLGRELGLRLFSDITSKQFTEVEGDVSKYRRSFLVRHFSKAPIRSSIRLVQWVISKFSRGLVKK